MKLRLTYLACFISFYTLLSSCKKAIDIIEHHGEKGCDVCKVEQIIANHDGHQDVVNVDYNKKGNPIKMLVNNNYYQNTTQTFRYDNQDRLQDYMITYGNNTGVLIWHRYHYQSEKIIIDSIINYAGELSDSQPPPFDPQYSRINKIYLDDLGRIIKIKNIYPYPMTKWTYTYNASGNKVGNMYDNGINVYKTNKVWQFVYNDFSVNNPIYSNIGVSTHLLKISDYNFFGLPRKFVAIGNDSGTPNLASVFGLFYHSATITYSCDKFSQSANQY